MGDFTDSKILEELRTLNETMKKIEQTLSSLCTTALIALDWMQHNNPTPAILDRGLNGIATSITEAGG